MIEVSVVESGIMVSWEFRCFLKKNRRRQPGRWHMILEEIKEADCPSLALSPRSILPFSGVLVGFAQARLELGILWFDISPAPMVF
jgi:hypothetical protein